MTAAALKRAATPTPTPTLTVTATATAIATGIAQEVEGKAGVGHNCR